MKVGDIVECHRGELALILSVEKLYPRHSESPARGFQVQWLDIVPDWHRPGINVPAQAIKRVVSRI